MRRRTVHALFALAAGASAALGAGAWAELDRATDVRDALERIADGASEVPAGVADEPRVQLARAVKLSAARDLDAAEPLLAALGGRGGDPAVARDARLALANAYLREGARPEADPARARSFLELAKQRYREALRAAPDDLDARYNLERALRLAPEGDELAVDEDIDAVKSVDVIFPDFAPTDLP